MKKPIAFILSSFLFCISAFAADGEYAVSKIPAALLKNANAVIRFDQTWVELRSLDKLIIKQKFAITILNDQGDRYADVYEFYDGFQSIEKFEGILFDANGVKIKSLKKADIKDQSATSNISLADDNRVKAHNFYYKVYPYTIEYEIEVFKKQTMFFPHWQPVQASLLSVEHSSFIMVTPAEYLLRSRAFNYTGEPQIKLADGKKEYIWQITNFEAIKQEYASPSLYKITPTVFLAPTDFLIEGYRGNMTDWKELGKFQYSLNNGRNELPKQVKQKVSDLVSNLKSDREKIETLYTFLQKNTRYVSIQLGVGGWRPYDANYVGTKGYGDCKALSNYMYSLLHAAGIKSYYTLIRAGDNEDDILADFPSRQFNHAILCVPNNSDTIWLECTDQVKSPGYMGQFTGNRHALLITEEGGVLVKTPHYGIKENVQKRIINAKLDGDGMLAADIKTRYASMQQDDLHMLISNLSKDKVKEYLDEELDFATYTVNNFAYKENKGVLPAIEEQLSVSVDHYATISGKRLFIVPNIMTRSGRKLKADEERKFDIELSIEYTDIDTAEIEIPGGYKPESVPADTKLESKFGKYNSSVQLKGNKIVYYRSMEQYGGNFPKTEYGEMVKFYDAIHKADRNKLVLVKTEEAKKPF